MFSTVADFLRPDLVPVVTPNPAHGINVALSANVKYIPVSFLWSLRTHQYSNLHWKLSGTCCLSQSWSAQAFHTSSATRREWLGNSKLPGCSAQLIMCFTCRYNSDILYLLWSPLCFLYVSFTSAFSNIVVSCNLGMCGPIQPRLQLAEELPNVLAISCSDSALWSVSY